MKLSTRRANNNNKNNVRKEIIICDICLEKQINIARSKQQQKKRNKKNVIKDVEKKTHII